MKKRVGVVLGAMVYAGIMPLFAHAAQIYINPATGKYPPGVTFPVDVRLDTGPSQCINAAEVDIAYPADVLQAVAVSDGDSIFSMWVKNPTIYSQYGIISFVGGLPGGYCGRVPGDPSLSNKLATIYFRFATSTAAGSSTAPESALLAFLPGTQATLNDGEGTIAPLTTAGAKYAEILQGQFAPVDTWQKALEDDTVPPEPFAIGVYRDPSLFNNQWFATFSTVDKQTGIDHYEVAEIPSSNLKLPEDQWNWKRAISPYLLTDQSLTDTIAVRAFDAAGNERLEEYTPTTTVPKGGFPNASVFSYVAILGVIGLVLVQLLFRIF